jgi:hypothetical protein
MTKKEENKFKLMVALQPNHELWHNDIMFTKPVFMRHSENGKSINVFFEWASRQPKSLRAVIDSFVIKEDHDSVKFGRDGDCAVKFKWDNDGLIEIFNPDRPQQHESYIDLEDAVILQAWLGQLILRKSANAPQIPEQNTLIGLHRSINESRAAWNLYVYENYTFQDDDYKCETANYWHKLGEKTQQLYLKKIRDWKVEVSCRVRVIADVQNYAGQRGTVSFAYGDECLIYFDSGGYGKFWNHQIEKLHGEEIR